MSRVCVDAVPIPDRSDQVNKMNNINLDVSYLTKNPYYIARFVY